MLEVISNGRANKNHENIDGNMRGIRRHFVILYQVTYILLGALHKIGTAKYLLNKLFAFSYCCRLPRERWQWDGRREEAG